NHYALPMIYPIVAYGDPVLKKVAEDIKKGEDLTQLIADMYETMYNASGVGLAAPQIGLSKRLFIVDTGAFENTEEPTLKKVFINPVIIEETGEDWNYEEGCLSIPGIRAGVDRPAHVLIKYY